MATLLTLTTIVILKIKSALVNKIFGQRSRVDRVKKNIFQFFSRYSYVKDRIPFVPSLFEKNIVEYFLVFIPCCPNVPQ